MKKTMIFMLIILAVIVGIIWYINRPDVNIYGMPQKKIILKTSNRENVAAHLVSCNINESNSLNNVINSEFYKEMKNKSASIPFKEISGNEMSFTFDIFGNLKTPFNVVTIIFLDKNLSFVGKHSTDIRLDKVFTNIRHLPKDTSLYAYITFTNKYKNKNFQATYMAKIKTEK